jgi:tight adherence protein B
MLSPSEWWGRRRRNRELDRQLPDVLYQMAVAMKAGRSFTEVLSMVHAKGVGLLSDEFARANQELRSGRDQEEVLEEMAKRVGNKDLELAVVAINVQSRVQGNLSEALTTIAERIRDRVRLRDEVRTLTIQTRASGYILTIIPIALAIFLFFVAPGYDRPLLTTPLGGLLYTLVAVLLVLGNIVMYRMGAVDV